MRQLLDQTPEEFNNLCIIVMNTEKQAVENGHGILLDVGRVLTDALNNFQIKNPRAFNCLSA